MVLNFSRWLWALLHRRTGVVAIPRVDSPLPAAAQPATPADGAERLTAARFVH